MQAALFTNEYPPNIYGGAGVHVEYLSRELAKKIDVEVHCLGDQNSDVGHLDVRGSLGRNHHRHHRQVQRRSEALASTSPRSKH